MLLAEIETMDGLIVRGLVGRSVERDLRRCVRGAKPGLVGTLALEARREQAGLGGTWRQLAHWRLVIIVVDICEV